MPSAYHVIYKTIEITVLKTICHLLYFCVIKIVEISLKFKRILCSYKVVTIFVGKKCKCLRLQQK